MVLKLTDFAPKVFVKSLSLEKKRGKVSQNRERLHESHTFFFEETEGCCAPFVDKIQNDAQHQSPLGSAESKHSLPPVTTQFKSRTYYLYINVATNAK